MEESLSNECLCGPSTPCQCNNYQQTVGGELINSLRIPTWNYSMDIQATKEAAIYATIKWAELINKAPSQEEFQKQLEYFLNLFTLNNKQMNG